MTGSRDRKEQSKHDSKDGSNDTSSSDWDFDMDEMNYSLVDNMPPLSAAEKSRNPKTTPTEDAPELFRDLYASERKKTRRTVGYYIFRFITFYRAMSSILSVLIMLTMFRFLYPKKPELPVETNPLPQDWCGKDELMFQFVESPDGLVETIKDILRDPGYYPILQTDVGSMEFLTAFLAKDYKPTKTELAVLNFRIKSLQLDYFHNSIDIITGTDPQTCYSVNTYIRHSKLRRLGKFFSENKYDFREVLDRYDRAVEMLKTAYENAVLETTSNVDDRVEAYKEFSFYLDRKNSKYRHMIALLFLSTPLNQIRDFSMVTTPLVTNLKLNVKQFVDLHAYRGNRLLRYLY